MPERRSRIEHIGDREAPRLDARCNRRRHAELTGQIEGLDVLPTWMDVVDEHMHHHVLSPLLDVVALQQESVRSET